VDSPPQRPVWVAIWGEVQRRLFLIGYAVAEEQAAVPERRVFWERWDNGRRPHRCGRGRRLGRASGTATWLSSFKVFTVGGVLAV